MAGYVYYSGAWRTMTAIYAYASGAWRTMTAAYYHDGSAWRQFFSGEHTVTKSGDATGLCTAPSGSCLCTTDSVTAIVSGGVGPFTYAWSYVSGTSATVTSPSSASTTFSRTAAVSDPANVLVGVYRCTVADTGNGGLEKTVDVTVTTSHWEVV